ncbi:MAG TPA: hypothetical protein VGP57_20715 [Actinoplanes sp.]|nr:hypothetical protein [Actinoplanes sp.]
MNFTSTRSRLIGLVATTLLLAGIGLAGTANVAGAAVSRGSDAAAPQAAAAVQPLAITPVSSVVGTWTLTTDFGCDGSITGSFTQTFNANGTWSSSPFVHSGRWYQVGGYVVWSFADTANLVYAANLSGSWMTGAQGFEDTSGTQGCFGGHLASVAGLAGAPAARGGVDAAVGR